MKGVALFTVIGKGAALVLTFAIIYSSEVAAQAAGLFALTIAAVTSPFLSWGMARVPAALLARPGVDEISASRPGFTLSAAAGLSGLGACLLTVVLGTRGDLIALTCAVALFAAARHAAAGALRSLSRVVLATFLVQVGAPLAGMASIGVMRVVSGEDLSSNQLMAALAVSAVLPLVVVLRNIVEACARPVVSRAAWRLGGVFVVSGTLGLLSTQIAGVLGPSIVNEQDYALLATAIRVGLVISAPLEVLAGALPPELARAYSAGNFEKLEGRLRSSAGAATAVSILLAPVAVAALIVPFGASGQVLAIAAIIVVSQLINVSSGSSSLSLTYTGGERQVLALAAVSVAVGTIAAASFGAVFGVVGLALSQVVASGAKNGGAIVAVRRRHGIWVHAGRFTLRGLL